MNGLKRFILLFNNNENACIIFLYIRFVYNFTILIIFFYSSPSFRASADAMRQAAVSSGIGSSSGQPTTNDRAGIINNAQPFSFTGAVGTDSNV